MEKPVSEFSIVISGVGGQGLITLLRILSEAAFKENYEVRTAELHGLAQRGGSVEVHLRFGSKIYSPLVKAGGAHLIVSLEAGEALLASRYASKTATTFLINRFFQPVSGNQTISEKEIIRSLKEYSVNVFIVPASDICKEKLGTEVVSGIYLLGYAISKRLLPLKKESIIFGLKKTVPKEYLEMNLKALNLPGK